MTKPLGLDPSESGADPLGPASYAALVRAGRDLRPVRRCERVANASGLCTLMAGLVSLPFVLGSGVGLALAVSLCVLGGRELLLRKGLQSLEPLACRRLASNQLMLGGSLAAYAIVQLLRGPGALGSVAGSQLEQTPELAASFDGILRIAHAGLYAGLVVVAVLVQGSQALYYRRVGSKLRIAYQKHPMWVMRVHAAAWSGEMPDRIDGPVAPSAPIPERAAA